MDRSWMGPGAVLDSDEEKISQPLLGLEPLIIQPIDQEQNCFMCTARNTTLCEMHFSANMTKNLCIIIRCELYNLCDEVI